MMRAGRQKEGELEGERMEKVKENREKNIKK